MERDPKLSKLINESGLTHAPVGFTDQVMDRIRIEPVKSTYKPVVGRGGKILILLVIVSIVMVSIVVSEPGGELFEKVGRLTNVEWKLPQINFNVDFFSGSKISTWLASTVGALFLLVLSDSVLRRRKRMT